MQTGDHVTISHITPVLPVSDMESTLSYYAEELGFDTIWRWDEPTTVANARRRDCTFLFTLDAERHSQCKGLEIMVFVRGIEVLWQELKAKNATVVDALELKPWGLSEFSIKDVNSYLLRFAENTG